MFILLQAVFKSPDRNKKENDVSVSSPVILDQKAKMDQAVP